MSKRLALHEEFMLLALREETGTFSASVQLECPLAAAVLSELLLQKRIELDNSKKKNKLVNVIDSSDMSDPILNEALQKISNAKRRGSLKSWVMKTAQIKKLKHRVAQQLCQKDILYADKDKILLIFDRKIYPELDPKPEQELTKRLHEAIFSDNQELEHRDVILIALASRAKLLRKKFDKHELKSRKKRIKMISEGVLTAKAAQEVMDAMNAAIMIAVIIPTITSS